MKVAVTGASGFIGRHLVCSLRAHGHAVRSLVRDLSTAPESDETRAIDLSFTGPLDEALAGVDAVIHAAAYLPASYADPGETRKLLEVNALGTLAVLEACVRNPVRKVIVFSSNVYRHGTDAVTEEAPTYPSVHAPYYMMSKLCAEVWADHFDRTGKLQTASLRLASVYGPGLERGMIPTFTATLVQGQPITIKDGGRYRSDLVFVGDVVEATERALLRDVHGIFNVGSGMTSSALEIAEALVTLTGASRDLLIVEPPASGPVAFGFAPLDITRAREQLGYAPCAIKDALCAYVDWYRSRR
ncbi:NAD(P)-dependent oxidoreductase [Enhydrobacter sp.]|uniref:NAD-dependent epimerase/dehydratase family protein n=1 Tax=Enhydrobacter sp. TaxID=1894999 RepID=UPI002609D7CC|nr:NAD(P)-dependent oxidoreductase [Enhydrobacter sp.]WIM13722.1 MAG: UDP-glucose 4-epimerase [Enhydrobacter sp.]